MNDQSRCQSAAFFWLRKSACRIDQKVSPCNGTGRICEVRLFSQDQARRGRVLGVEDFIHSRRRVVQNGFLLQQAKPGRTALSAFTRFARTLSRTAFDLELCMG
jgi:hypothetical protein